MWVGYGYEFAARYVGRTGNHSPSDLTEREVDVILGEGLGLMVVQHVLPGSWIPDAGLGASYGRQAAAWAKASRVPSGVSLWLDLESVAQGTHPKDVIEYCNNWHSWVAGEGYLPGLYVGWRAGLTPRDLYFRLRFTHYWGAYNLNADQFPAVRGVQMQQKEQVMIHGLPPFDPDVVQRDALGGLPAVLLPEGAGV